MKLIVVTMYVYTHMCVFNLCTMYVFCCRIGAAVFVQRDVIFLFFRLNPSFLKFMDPIKI